MIFFIFFIETEKEKSKFSYFEMGRNQMFPQIGNQKSVKFEIKVTQNWQKLNFHTLMTTTCK